MHEATFGREFLVARFDDEQGLVRAARAVRAAGFRIYDAFTPYPVHALDPLVTSRHSRLPLAALAGGIAGLALTFSFEVYASVFDWPLDVGGKPDYSPLAFVPVAFEIMVLGAALTIAAAFCVRCRLFPAARAKGAEFGATDDAFVLVLRFRETAFDANHARWVLHDAGANDVSRRVMDL